MVRRNPLLERQRVQDNILDRIDLAQEEVNAAKRQYVTYLAGDGRWLRRTNPPGTMPVFSPDQPEYGAKGDGVADDLQAIQSAISDAHAIGGGIVALTPGKDYAVDGVITLRKHVTLKGQSRYGDASAGAETRIIQQNATANTIRVVSSNDSVGMGVENIVITFKDGTRTTGGGVVFEDDGGGAFLGLHIKNVVVRYHGRGIHIENTVESTIEKCRVLNCGTGYLIDVDTSGAGITTTKFDHCFAQNCNDYGFRNIAPTLTSVTFIGCAVDACPYGFHFGGAVLRDVTMIGCYAEDRAVGPDLISAVFSSGSWQGFTVIGLTCYDAIGHAIDLSGSGSMAIVGGRVQGTAATFYDLNHTGTGYVDLVGDYKVIFVGNGAGRINDANGTVVYHDYRTLQSQRQDAAGANSIVPAHTQYGTVTITSDTAASSVTAAVTFPETFSAFHGAHATPQGFGLGGKRITVNVESGSVSGITIRLATVDGSNFSSVQDRDVFWTAKGVRF